MNVLLSVLENVSVSQGYSTLAVIHEMEGSWVLPLRHERITSFETPITKGVFQLKQACRHLSKLPLLLADSEYANAKFLKATIGVEADLLMRLRPNRVLYGPPPAYSGKGLCCMKEKCKMVLYCKGEKMGDKYRVKNWSEYDAGLKQRGSLTFWVNEEVLKSWVEEEKTGKQGASPKYSDQAIITMMTIKRVMGLARRQTEGFVESLFMLMGVDLPVPDHTTVSRRLGKLEIELPVKPSTKARHVVVDSTGIKIYGEGEWKTRQHGVSKRRTWRKLHLAIDESTGEILEAEVTTNDYGDCEILEGLLEEIEGEIEQVSGDGGYDTFDCHEAIQKKGAKAAIPPQKNAVPTHKRGEPAEHPRDKILERIEILGRKGWKEESEYHRRSKAENTMFRLKTIFGGKISSREFENQAVELFIQCAALNRMIQIASPVSFKVL